jgi:hypothetical protein
MYTFLGNTTILWIGGTQETRPGFLEKLKLKLDIIVWEFAQVLTAQIKENSNFKKSDILFVRNLERLVHWEMTILDDWIVLIKIFIYHSNMDW